MNPSDYRICLDLQAPHGAVELSMKQGDSHRCIYITLTDGGRLYEPANCCPVFTAKKPDGTVLYNRCRVEAQTVIYQVTPQTTASPGRVSCELRLYSPELETDDEGRPIPETGKLITSAAFTVAVHPQVCQDGDVVASAPEATALEALVAEGMALVDTVQTKLDNGAFVGEKGEKGEKGDKGDKGDQGEKGDPGQVNIDDGETSDTDTWSSRYIYENLEACVQYYPQTKTAEQQAQARKNIGAIADGDSIGALEIVNKLYVDQEADIDFHDNLVKGVAAGEADTDAVNKKQLDDAQTELVDKLCPEFSKSGTVVTCQPVEGYPLAVTAEEGSTIARCGKNLVNPTAYMRDPNGDTTLNGDVFTSVTTSGTLYVNTNWGGRAATHPAGTYTLSIIPMSDNVALSVIVYSVSSGATIASKVCNTSRGYTFTFTASGRFRVSVGGGSGDMWGTHTYKLQLEVGSVATEYESYVGQTFTSGEQIPALQGVNTLYANTGEITVTGREDPRVRMQKLENAILSLGGNV